MGFITNGNPLVYVVIRYVTVATYPSWTAFSHAGIVLNKLEYLAVYGRTSMGVPVDELQ